MLQTSSINRSEVKIQKKDAWSNCPLQYQALQEPSTAIFPGKTEAAVFLAFLIQLFIARSTWEPQ